MRLNENTKIIGKNIVLVPYEAKHVEKYHKWMQNHELQELTASMPLSLEAEYEMQKSWREDNDKCTFLVLCGETFRKTNDEIAAMVGDVNLFFRHMEESTELVAEAEIMIAEPNARGKKYGWEAMLLMFKYSQANFPNLCKFEVKIGMSNEKSLRMFEKLQFIEVGRSAVFQEVTMERLLTNNWLDWLNEQIQLRCEPYRNS